MKQQTSSVNDAKYQEQLLKELTLKKPSSLKDNLSPLNNKIKKNAQLTYSNNKSLGNFRYKHFFIPIDKKSKKPVNLHTNNNNNNQTSLLWFPSQSRCETINEMDEKYISSNSLDAVSFNWIKQIRSIFRVSNFPYIIPYQIDNKTFNIEVSFHISANPKTLNLGLKIVYPIAEDSNNPKKGRLITVVNYNFLENYYKEEDLVAIVLPKNRYF